MAYDFEAFTDAVDKHKDHERDVLLAKQRDYGPGNIANCPLGAREGLVVRLYDKIARLANLVQSGAEPENEALADTWLDIANYGTIGAMVEAGDWPTLD